MSAFWGLPSRSSLSVFRQRGRRDARAHGEALAVVVSSVRGMPNPWFALGSSRDGTVAAMLLDRIAAAAESHGVSGWVLKAALEAGVDVPPVRRHAASAMARHLRAVGDLGVCREALDGAGIKFLVAKGPALNAVVHRDAGLRSYVDLDLAVDRTVFPGALEALEAAGLLLLDRNWTLLRAAEAQELRLRTASGGVVDLHSSLGRGPASTDHAPSVKALWERGRHFDGPHGPVRTLGPADTLVHLAMHAADAGGHRLVWLADLRAAWLRAMEGGVSPTEVTHTAEEWGGLPALALMLRRVSRILDEGIPIRMPAGRSPGQSSRRIDGRRSPLSSGDSGTLGAPSGPSGSADSEPERAGRHRQGGRMGNERSPAAGLDS